MKIYIAGPMRGYTDYNFPAFFDAAVLLQAEGWETINPAQIEIDNGFDKTTPEDMLTEEDLKVFILRDIQLVMSADAIIMLDGHRESRGAAVELAIAKYCGLPVYLMEEGRVIR
jgi:nucleoside 2-deoxyribosyltransferase